MAKERKIIGRKDYFALSALLAVAQKHYNLAHELIAEMAEILGRPPDDPSDEWLYFGHISDALLLVLFG
jgi:hypothetical protein